MDPCRQYTSISGNTVDIQLADAPVFAGKLTANGLDANGEKVTNVGAGTAATDAVNKGQLDALSTSSNNKTDALGNSTANNPLLSTLLFPTVRLPALVNAMLSFTLYL
ncbi:hypothetical protein JRZ81_18425 [Acinetobacter nosocomialis]|nr:hypothetical protein [Acinetobacter nosocomialis]